MYHLRITYQVSLAEWRIDDPRIPENSNWALQVYDRNLQQWVYLSECTRPGENVLIEKIEVLDEFPGQNPTSTADGAIS